MSISQEHLEEALKHPFETVDGLLKEANENLETGYFLRYSLDLVHIAKYILQEFENREETKPVDVKKVKPWNKKASSLEKSIMLTMKEQGMKLI